MSDTNPNKTPADWLADLVALPGPPGGEGAVCDYLRAQAEQMGLQTRTDAKNNLLIEFGNNGNTNDTTSAPFEVVVTAHMDEIALMVTQVYDGGVLTVAPMGGVHPWKWGEGPVEILCRDGFVPGVLGFGGIHTSHPASAIAQARNGAAITWDMARIVTGLSASALQKKGVRPGSRVCLARSRRALFPLGGLIGSYFLDDRADLVAWLRALQMLQAEPLPAGFRVLWAATASEEVGGHGALYLLREAGRTPVCIALEIGPTTPDDPFPVTDTPTVWVSDGFAASLPADLDLVEEAGRTIGLSPYFHALTRGGSDASCAAAQGLCARPITLAFAADNSHGFEIMHQNAPENLARLLVAVLRRLAPSKQGG